VALAGATRLGRHPRLDEVGRAASGDTSLLPGGDLEAHAGGSSASLAPVGGAPDATAGAHRDPPVPLRGPPDERRPSVTIKRRSHLDTPELVGTPNTRSDRLGSNPACNMKNSSPSRQSPGWPSERANEEAAFVTFGEPRAPHFFHATPPQARFPAWFLGKGSSPGWTRTNNISVNSRTLCQLSYRGSLGPAL
jgi:hypothetical protein